jgi:hypothetical protein
MSYQVQQVVKCRKGIFLNQKNILVNLGIIKFGLHIFRHTFGDNAAMNINLAVMSKLMVIVVLQSPANIMLELLIKQT